MTVRTLEMTNSHVRDRQRGLYVPMVAAAAYLAGTFLLFLAVGQVELVPNLAKLTEFVVATIVCFALGYVAKIRSYRPAPVQGASPPVPRGWIKWSAAYYAIYGLALLVEYGATQPSAVLRRVLHPGSAYFAKFAVYTFQTQTNEKNPLIQLLTIVAVLYLPLIPFVTLFWGRLSIALRAAALVSVAVYATFFLFIGTLKGLGDLLVFFLAAFMVRTAWARRDGSGPSGRRLLVLSSLILVVFVSYMAVNQAQRVQHVGIESRFQPNPVIASVAGENFARGMAVVAFYPTHGYVGLGYDLETPFEWSKGLGASPALSGYWVQYFGGEGASQTAYPYRTEARTGWSATEYWSTIYPWLASDLTFPGTVLFMGAVGWFLARFWYESVNRRSLLSVLLFCQLIFLLAYVPANNQIGTSRTSLIAFVSLVAAYAVRHIRTRQVPR